MGRLKLGGRRSAGARRARTGAGSALPASARRSLGSVDPRRSRGWVSWLGMIGAAPGRAGGPAAASLEDRAGEVVGVEGPQVLEPLAHPGQLDRHAELLRDRERDASLRGAVQLG